MSVVQIPFSLVDRRFEKSDFRDFKDRHGLVVHARSIFLQGLLLNRSGPWLSRLNSEAMAALNSYWNFIDKTKTSPLAACLSAAIQSKLLDKIVIGLDSVEHLEQIVNESNNGSVLGLEAGKIMHSVEDLCIPMRWTAR